MQKSIIPLLRDGSLVIIASSAILFGEMSNARAQQTQEYRGVGCIIATNPHCAPDWGVGDCAAVRFSPPNVHGNGDRTSVSIHYQTYSINYQTNESLLGFTYKPVQFSWVGRNGGIASTETTMRIPLVQPSNYSTPWLHALFDILRYSDFTPGDPSYCRVWIRFTGQKYPDQAPAANDPLVSSGGFGNDSAAIGSGSNSLD